MARTTQEILTDLLADKTTRAELAVLTNPSNASLWYNLYGVLAAQIAILETLQDDVINDLNERALEIPVGTLLWYKAETLNYQFGDSLIITDGIPSYAVEDDLKKVVKVSAAIEQSGAIIIKAAKLDGSNNPIPLSAAELSGLTQYWVEKRFAGSFLSVISENGDPMNAALRIEVDGSKIAVTGESQITPGTYPVEDAIKEYYRLTGVGTDGKSLNGRFTVTSLIDAIQSVDGVGNSVKATEIKAKADGAVAYVDVLTTDDQSYVPWSGYLVEDTSNLLRNTLTYVLI